MFFNLSNNRNYNSIKQKTLANKAKVFIKKVKIKNYFLTIFLVSVPSEVLTESI